MGVVIRRTMCDSINTLLTKLLRSKQLLLLFIVKNERWGSIPRLEAGCHMFSVYAFISTLWGSSSVGRAATLRLASQKARVGSSPTSPTKKQGESLR